MHTQRERHMSGARRSTSHPRSLAHIQRHPSRYPSSVHSPIRNTACNGTGTTAIHEGNNNACSNLYVIIVAVVEVLASGLLREWAGSKLDRWGETGCWEKGWGYCSRLRRGGSRAGRRRPTNLRVTAAPAKCHRTTTKSADHLAVGRSNVFSHLSLSPPLTRSPSLSLPLAPPPSRSLPLSLIHSLYIQSPSFSLSLPLSHIEQSCACESMHERYAAQSGTPEAVCLDSGERPYTHTW